MPRGSSPGERRGGRQKGTPNRTTTEKRIRAASGISEAKLSGVMPLDIILAVAAGGEPAALITDRQLQAAIAAAPYIHPKLSAVAMQDVTPDPAVDERSAHARAEVMKLLEDMAKPEPLNRSGADQDRIEASQQVRHQPTMKTDPPPPAEW